MLDAAKRRVQEAALLFPAALARLGLLDRKKGVEAFDLAVPVMVTGGFRTRTAMEAALEEGVSVIGIARPFCLYPDTANKLLSGEWDELPAPEKGFRLGPGIVGPHSGNDLVKAANGFAAMSYFYRNIIRMADGRPTKSSMNLWVALIRHQMQEKSDAKQVAMSRA